MSITISGGITLNGGGWTIVAPPTVPNAPTIGTATATGSATATVSFTAPTNNGGATITSYTATSSPGGITGTLSQAGSGTITVSGLSGSTSYTFTVTATNSIGTSIASSASNSITTSPSGPTTIGQAYGGGYYAGQISTTGNGVATHYLIIAPKATGQTTGQAWGPYAQAVSTSSIDGPTNTTNMVAVGSGPATFCKNLTIGGYTDWYMPAQDELAVIYYYLKPTATSNDTAGYGSTPYAVSPMPANTNWTSSVPGQTSVAIFQSGNSEFLATNTEHWSSTQISIYSERALGASNGAMPGLGGYNTDRITRAIRRVPV